MEENIKKCPFCAEIINAEAIKCKHCGSDLDTAKVGMLKNEKGSYKNKTTAGLLALLFGTFGAHKFYLGKNVQGLLYLLLFWTFIPTVIGFIEGLSYFSYKQNDWDSTFNKIGEKTKAKSFRLY